MYFIDSSLSTEKLNSKDFSILDNIKNNSRISYQQLAQKSRLNRDIIVYRVKKLEENKIINNYTLNFNPNIFEINEYYVLLQLFELTDNKTKELYEFLIKQNEIVEIISYTDKWDLKLRIFVKNVKELNNLLTKINNNFFQIINDQEIMQVIDSYPLLKETKLKIDKIDILILNKLLENSRQSLVNLSKTVNLTTDAIMHRIKKYQKSINFVTNINISKINKQVHTLMISTKVFTKEDEFKLKEFMVQNPEFVKAYKVIGNWNLIVDVVCSDLKEFHRLIQKFRSTFFDLIKDFDNLITYKHLKNKVILK